jgi:Helix-turn-helix.
MDIGQFIKARRLELKFSQRQVALNSDLSNATISRIEGGAVIPDAATLSKIAKALKLNPSLLFKISGYINEPVANEPVAANAQKDDLLIDTGINSENKLKRSNTLRNFSARLKDLRESVGYSQDELGEAIGYGPGTVKAWEAGTGTPDSGAVQRTAAFFGVTVSYLMGQSDVKYTGPRQRDMTPKKESVLRETESQDIREVLKELSKAVENAQKVLAMYSKEDKNDG